MTPSYKLTVGNDSNTNYSMMSAYFEGNITSAGYITRTSIFDKSKGNALDLIKDSSQLTKDGKIDHTQFYGYTTWNTTETDMSKPVVENQNKEVCEDKIIEEATNETDAITEKQCHNETEQITTYPFTKEVKNEGVSLDAEIDVLRQAVYELKIENQNLKSRLDKIESETCTIKLFSWCLK